jgi:hypothetical protein
VHEATWPLQEVQANSCAQIHDELVALVRKEHLPRAARLVHSAMESVGKGHDWWRVWVPPRVKLETGATGPSWGELQKYECPQDGGSSTVVLDANGHLQRTPLVLHAVLHAVALSNPFFGGDTRSHVMTSLP